MLLVGMLIGSAVAFLLLGLRNKYADKGGMLEERLKVRNSEHWDTDAEVQRDDAGIGKLFQNLLAEIRKTSVNTNKRVAILLTISGAAIVGIVFYVLTNRLAMGVVGCIVGMFLPKQYLKIRQAKRYERFIKKFDSALLLAVSSLKAGSSVQQAFEEVSQKASEVVATEFEKIVHAIKLGATPADAVSLLVEDLPGPEVEMFSMATNILTRTGGNLADIYSSIAARIADNKSFHDSMKAHTAEGRLSALIIGILPFAMTGIIMATNPHYFDPFLSTPIGRIVFGLCYLLIGVGWFVMKHMLEIQVD